MNKCQSILSAALVVGAFVAAPASAQFYAGIGAGQSHMGSSSFPAGTNVTASGFDQNRTSFQVNGGYQIDPMWGVEIQYTDLGSRSGTVCNGAVCTGTGDIKAYQWGIAGTGTFDINREFFVRGKLGISSNHVDSVSGTVNGIAYNTSGSSNTDVLAGIAVGYRWSKNFATRLEYEYFGKFESNNGAASVKGSNIGLRMQYSFD